MKLSCLLAATFPVVFQDEADLVALIEGVDSGGLKRGRMDEYVLVAGTKPSGFYLWIALAVAILIPILLLKACMRG